MPVARHVRRAFARVVSGLAATTSSSTSTASPRVPVAARAHLLARGNATAATTPYIDRYGASKGPMAGLLRVLRDDGALTTRELFDRRPSSRTPTHSMRHMKGLLAKMKAIDRVKTTPPVAVSASGEEGRRAREEGTRAGKLYAVNHRDGMKHIEKLDRSVPPPAPASG